MKKEKIIGYWLLIGVAMLIIQVLLGGITRLTGSGLSITEWKPILGVIPPLNEETWNRAFDMYKEKTGQYKYLNNDFTLSDFKFIYFWEWLHRSWAWLISVVFLIPFFFFAFKKYFTPAIISKLVALFLLGIAQGLIGWIMVKSGFGDENLYVSHIKLAVHFISALVLISFTFWFAMSLLVQDKDLISNISLKNWTVYIIVLLGIQLVYGAFMAGLKAATEAPTWPSINGDYFPSALSTFDFLYDKINIHFIHRMLAYLLLILMVVWYLKAIKANNSVFFNRIKLIPVVLISIQILLGIFTVLTSTHMVRNGFGTFEYLAQAHQLIAMFLLMSLIAVLYSLKTKRKDI